MRGQGFVVLPAALDPLLTRASLDATWDTIEAHVPRMRRDNPSTWFKISAEETAAAAALDRQLVGPDGYAPTGFGGMISIHDGTQERVLDLFPRALFNVVEQLLGEDTVVWPVGHDENGMTSGPVLVDDNVVYVRAPLHCTHAVNTDYYE